MQLKYVWSRIQPSVLSNLVASMPNRVRYVCLFVGNTLSTEQLFYFQWLEVWNDFKTTSRLFPDPVGDGTPVMEWGAWITNGDA